MKSVTTEGYRDFSMRNTRRRRWPLELGQDYAGARQAMELLHEADRDFHHNDPCMQVLVKLGKI